MAGACSLGVLVYVHSPGPWPSFWGIRPVTNAEVAGLTGSEELEPTARRRLLARRGRGGLSGCDPLREREDVLRDLAVTMADDEGDSAVDRQHERPAIGDDRVRDLATEAGLDIRRFDPTGAVVTVGDELHFRLVVPQLLDDLHENADVLEAGDLERHQRKDHIGHVEHRDDLLLE